MSADSTCLTCPHPEVNSGEATADWLVRDALREAFRIELHGIYDDSDDLVEEALRVVRCWLWSYTESGVADCAELIDELDMK